MSERPIETFSLLIGIVAGVCAIASLVFGLYYQETVLTLVGVSAGLVCVFGLAIGIYLRNN
jgi:hypothetical protein